MNAGERRYGSLAERVLDVAAVIAVVVEAARTVRTGDLTALPALVLAVAAVAVRRRFPVAAGAGVVLASIAVFAAEDAAVPVWVLAQVCMFTLALRSGRPVLAGLASVHGGVLYAGAVLVFGAGLLDPVALILPVWTAAVAAAGLAVRAHGDTLAALTEQARTAGAVREQEVLVRVGEERLAIARDLHDAVAHTIAVINIHAGAAEASIRTDPDRARESLRQVRTASRAVMDELQDLVSVLRSSRDADDVTRPLASVAGLPALLDSVVAPGAPVDARLDPLPPLDPAVDAAVYRVVQEATTNARRHGGGGLSVTVTTAGDSVVVLVTNRLRATPTEGGGGFGLVGMQERVASAHGTLTTKEIEGRFVVRARFPLAPLHGRTVQR